MGMTGAIVVVGDITAALATVGEVAAVSLTVTGLSEMIGGCNMEGVFTMNATVGSFISGPIALGCVSLLISGIGSSFTQKIGPGSGFFIDDSLGVNNLGISGDGCIWIKNTINSQNASGTPGFDLGGNSTNGEFCCQGGVSIAKDVWIGGLVNIGTNLTVAGNTFLTNLTTTGISVSAANVNGLTVITSSGGVTIMTTSTNSQLVVVGSFSQTITLPNALLLPVGYQAIITNYSSGIVNVKDGTNTLLQYLSTGCVIVFTLQNNLSIGGTWNIASWIPSGTIWNTALLYTPSNITTTGTVQGDSLITTQLVIVSAGSTSPLNASDPACIIVTGSTYHTLQLASGTLLAKGYTYTIINQSTGTVTVQNYGGSTLQSVLSGGIQTFVSTSVAANAGWFWYGALPSGTYWGTNAMITSSAISSSQSITTTSFMQAETFISSLTIIVSSAGTTTLTNTSNTQIIVTGSTTQTIVLPDATSLPLGYTFNITNLSTGSVTIQSFGASTLDTLSYRGANQSFILKSNSSAGTWLKYGSIPSSGYWDDNGMDVSGTITANAITGTSFTGNQLTLLGTTSGGINLNPQAVAGSWNFNLPITAGTAGQILTSQGGGTTAMTWTNAGVGTVTSIGVTVPAFLSVTPTTITTNGTFAITLSGTALPVVNGGTGVTTSTGTGSVVLNTTPTFAGGIIVGATSTTALAVTTSQSASNLVIGSFLAGSNASGNSTQLQFGVGSTNGNSAILQHNYNTLSSSISLGFGFFGNNNIMKLNYSNSTSSLSINSGIASTNVTSGDLVTSGGIGCGKTLFALNGNFGSQSSTVPLVVTSNQTNANLIVASFLAANNTTTNNTTQVLVGVAGSNGNTGILQFNYVGSNAAYNSVGLGFSNQNNILQVFNTQTNTSVAVGINVGIASTSTGTGDLVTTGGIGCGGSINATGWFTGSSAISNLNTIVSSASTVTLTASSGTNILVTGSTTQKIVAPNATTLPLGIIYLINNNASGGITFYANDGTTLISLNGVPVGGFATFYLLTNGTANGTWDYHYSLANNTISSTAGLITSGYLQTSGGINLQGAGSGIVSLLTQSAAGTWNFNLPITAGTTGQVLTSQGGGSTAMTWTTPGTGTVTSVGMTVPAFLSISGSPITTSGTLAVGLSGTALPVANGGTGVTGSTGSGSVVLNNNPHLIQPYMSVLQLVGVTGTVTMSTVTNFSNYNFIFPSTAGTTGQFLTSGGGSTLTWTTPTTNTFANVIINSTTATVPLVMTSNQSGSVVGQTMLASSATNVQNQFGVAASNGNTAIQQFNYTSSNSASNNIGWGFWGNNNVMQLYNTLASPAAALYVAGGIASTSTTTGDIVAVGGISCLGAMYATSANFTGGGTALLAQSTSVNANLIVAGFYAASNTTVGNTTQVLVGVSAATGNSGILEFDYQGNNSSSNSVGLGFPSNNNVLKVFNQSSSNITVQTNGKISTNNGTDSFKYSEGTFAVTGKFATGTYLSYSFTSTGVTTGGYSTNYVKIGRQVTVTLSLAFSYGSNAADSVCIDGLPYAPVQDVVALASPSSNITGVTNDCNVFVSTTYPTVMFICVTGSNGHPFTPQLLGASSQLFIVTFTYYTTA